MRHKTAKQFPFPRQGADSQPFFSAYFIMPKTGNRTRKKRGVATRVPIRFKTIVQNVAPISKRSLSKNGPYIDAHFKNIDQKNPIGQTYYLRPVTKYNASTKTLVIKLCKDQPTVHMNSNSVSMKVLYEGTITITGFEYGKYNPDAIIDVSIIMHNKTGRELIGFHIHDGEVGGKSPCAGFTNFGPIIYFLYTTKYWDKKKTEKAFPLPPNDVTPMSSYVLHLSQGKI